MHMATKTVWGRARAKPRLALALAAVLVLGGSGTAFGQTDDFRQGVSLFEQGQYERALQALDRYLASNPSSEQARRARDEAGYQVFVQMLARKDDIAAIARRILELAEQADRFERPDAQRIRDLLKTMLSGEYEESYLAMNELASQIGPYCVPFVVETLADRRDNDKRVKAIVLLSRLGPDGTNAVIELLYHPDDYVRQNACAVLGHIRDIKGIPYLKAVMERAQESPHVKKTASEALTNILGEGAPQKSAMAYFQDLAELYFQEDPRVVLNNFKEWTTWDWVEDKLQYRVLPSYAWNDEMAENVCFDALDHAKRAQVAETELDPIYTLLVSAHFQEVVEVDAILYVAEAKAAAGEVSEEEMTALKEAKARLGVLKALSSALGEDQIAKALRKALVDRHIPLAIALIEQLRDMKMSEHLLPPPGTDLAAYVATPAAPTPTGLQVKPNRTDGGPVSTTSSSAPESAPQPPPAPKEETPPPAPKEESKPAEEPKEEGAPRRRRVSEAPASREERMAELFGPRAQRTLDGSGGAWGTSLAAALVYDDKRVRYSASEALVRLAPTKAFAGSDKVWENLSGAVGESSSRVILVVAEDQQVRNRLVGIVRKLNHLAFGVESAKTGLLRARSAPTQDAVIIHTRFRGTDFSTSEFIQEVERDYRTKGLPVIVVTPKEELRAKQELFPTAAGVLEDAVDPVILKDKLESLWTGANTRPNDPKLLAMQTAKMCAAAIAQHDTRRSVFELERCAPALLDAIEHQPDEVRVACLEALAALRVPGALDKVALVFENEANAREVRIAAALCIGESLRGRQVPSKVFESFLKAMKTGDRGIYSSCGEALGKAQLTREQAIQLMQALRVE